MHECKRSTCECGVFSMDSKTPLMVPLTAYYKRSFAFHTVKERMPVILTKLIDYLVRNKEQIIEEFGNAQELKDVIGNISKLKYEIQTNKPLCRLDSDKPDAKFYNQYLIEQSEKTGVCRFFTVIWLHAECYMYRRVKDFFDSTTTLKKFDYFKKQKNDAFQQSIGAMTTLAEYLYPKLKNTEGVDAEEEFYKLLKLNLWGNRCDLSISAGEDNSQINDPMETISKYESFILSNHSEKIWKLVSHERIGDHTPPRTISFVNDNAGYEMFTDFCVADYLITYGHCEHITFNVKSIPWFVSDTTPSDFRWILRTLINAEHPILKKLGVRWNKYIRENVWTYRSDSFWTLPCEFTKLKSQDSDLYNRLAASYLVIFKGDLNYRKLFGEFNWPPTTDITEALQGFHPAKLCILRTVKSDIICGLPKGVAEELNKSDPDWMTTGNYGVIQFSG